MYSVRLDCYCPKKDGSWNSSALAITFVTRTPFTFYFYQDRLVAFLVAGSVTMRTEMIPTRYAREIDGDGPEARAKRLEIGAFDRALESVLKRYFEPAHLDKGTHPGIIADWLQDMGHDHVAELIRCNS